MSVIKNNIPNTITCMNMLSGALACVAAFSFNEEVIWGLKGFQVAFMLIGCAAVFDFFDGFAARLLHAVSGIGKELDSLSDLISFGMAPSALIYNMMLHEGEGSVAFAAFAILIFGGIRLARFNVDTRQSTSFIGLPIPANAIFWIGFCSFTVDRGVYNCWTTIALIVLFAYLMVSPLKMFSLKMKSYRWSGNALRYILVIATIALVALFGIEGLSYSIALYVVLSLIQPKQTNENR